MAKKIKLTRPELKRHREALVRYERYLPMLKLKQQRLQATLRETLEELRQAEDELDKIDATLRRYRSILGDLAGVPLQDWARPSEVLVDRRNIAGLDIPVYRDVTFPQARYSLFGTPPWVDQTLSDLRERSRRGAVVELLQQQETLIRRELTHIIQRVNLFEQVMIPDAREAIRRIRIKLGDEMTAGVGRSKIAKKKLADMMESNSVIGTGVVAAADDGLHEQDVSGEEEQP